MTRSRDTWRPNRVADWPAGYHRAFVPARGTAHIYSALLMMRMLGGSPARAIRSSAVVVATVAVGLLLGALDKFATGWQLYLIWCLVLLAAGVVGGVQINATKYLVLYRAGSPSNFVIARGKLYLDLNSHYFKSDLNGVARVRRVLGLAVLVYTDDTILIVPWEALPVGGGLDAQGLGG